jgi:hypothetical protein
MTEGQIRGVLHRAVNARRPYVERKLDAESPNAYRYFFRVTLRGSVWIEWAKKVGLIVIEPEPDLDDEDDDDDEEEMAWLVGEWVSGPELIGESALELKELVLELPEEVLLV